ncbi:RNA-binding protein [Pseudochelatococcus contaminans]
MSQQLLCLTSISALSGNRGKEKELSHPEGDAPPQNDKDREDSRTCALSRRAMPKEAMIRFVAGPDGALVPDIRARLPGRGVWVEATREAVSQAARRKIFSRGLKTGLSVSPSLADDVEALLLRDMLQALALANKAGAVVTGFGKVEDLLARRDGKISTAALLHASEAAQDGRRKLAQALNRGRQTLQDGHIPPPDTIPVIDWIAGEDLDLALGRIHVIHAALVAGTGSDGFMTRWRRLDRYRMADTSTPSTDVSATMASRTDGPSGEAHDDRAITGQE